MVEYKIVIVSESQEALTGNNLYIDEIIFSSTLRRNNILDFIKKEYEVGKVLNKDFRFPKRKIKSIHTYIK